MQPLDQPPGTQIASALDLAAENALPQGYPTLAGVPSVPTVLLKAMAWVESRWRQFTVPGVPLISHDGGYGVMQVTHGLGGAAIDSVLQSALANNFIYNIASGARILSMKWLSTPRIGTGDPAVLEDWYYAVWAYNAWGWRNNPNNPAFTRIGTPMTHPTAFPYQERVFYAISHPPLDAGGQPLWTPVPVTLPDRHVIGRMPGPLSAPVPAHTDAAPTDGPLAFSFADGAQFRADLSIPDGAVVAPGAPLHKVWLFRNTGGLFWSGYSWRFMSGDRMAAPLSVSVPLAPPLADVPIGVDIVAPQQPGSYKGYWQLFNARNLALGPRAWVSVRVADVAQATALAATATVTATSTSLIDATLGTAQPTTPTLRTLATVTSANNAAYVADLTIPDGTVVRPGQTFTKVWEIQNTGTYTWDSRYHWQFEAGAPMGAVRAVPAPAVPPGATARFQVQMVAPARPRTYFGYWQMSDPAGNVFGSQAWVEVRVKIPTPATATPSATATPQPSTPAATSPPTSSAVPAATATPTATIAPRPTASPTAGVPARPTLVPWFGPAVSRAYFAEGYTGDGFHEYLSFLNPRSHTLRAQIAIYRADGATRLVSFALAPLARRSLDLNVLAPHASTAMIVGADSQVVVERALFTRNGHVVAGAPYPSHHWYVAEAYVGAGFRDELRIFNPGGLAAALTIDAFRGDGSVLVSHRRIAAGTRANVLLDDVAPIGASGLEIASSEPVVVESVVRGPGAAGPSAAMALVAPSRGWYFPDGGTSRGNEEYIALLNPSSMVATVRLSAVTADGYLPPVTLHVGPRSRAVYVVQGLIRLGGLAATVTSDQPIVAQEIRYARTGGVTVVDGAVRPARSWGIAEGHSGDGFKEWITLLNPGGRAASALVRLVTAHGVVRTLRLRVRAHHREYLYINHLVPAGPVSALVDADRPIVAGRTMIFNAGNGLSTTVGVALSGE